MRLGLPAKVVPQNGPGKSGSRWFSAQGQVQIETFRERGADLQAMFEQQRKEPPERKVEFDVLRPDFFVVAGLQGLKKFYVRAHAVGGEVRGLTILYDQAMEGIMSAPAIAMASALVPVSDNPPQQARRKVEYGTGLVVSSAGHILTDAQVVDGCHVIVVGGLGHADRVAEDNGLALLRIYAAGNFSPLALGDGEPAAITVVGIADPQVQGGGASVSQVSVRIAGATRAIEPAPVPGFGGAAAVDGEGRLAGLVALKIPTTAGSASAPQANVIPADSIRKFLAAANVAAGNAAADIKASVLRVICVRK